MKKFFNEEFTLNMPSSMKNILQWRIQRPYIIFLPDRVIQKRELFTVWEEGDTWRYSNNGYQNTKTQFKMEGKLSRTIDEELGVLQGKIKPWTMEGTTIDVVSENEHLGLIVSGEKEEEKNVHNRLTKGRKSLFGLLGPAFSQKCLLSPAVKIHLYRMYTCAITRSGLSSMVLRNSHMDLLNMFHKKTLRSFLSLSQRSPIPALYLIFGELPIEAKIHRDVFSLFFSLISNPKTKAYQMVRYLLHEGSENSRTWSVYLRRLCIKSVSYTHLTLPTKA